MFDSEAPKEKSPTDWSGTIIGVMLLPVFFVFVFLGKAELGFNVMLVLGLVMIAVRLRWKLRRYAWFWGTIAFVLLLHIPFLFLVHWPQSKVPTIAYSLPLAIADFLLISGAISLAQKVFSKNDSDDEEA
ncbi:MAG: hypothetical protein WBE76_05640 [Terracidiphilus sp.]